MTTRRRHGSTARLARQTAELAWATPQVMAHRMARMALAGPTLSERDRKEFQLMGMEKVAAFGQAWHAMAWAGLASSQAMAIQMWAACWTPWLGGPRADRLARQMQHAALGMMGKGMAPIHAKATANARRLAGTPLLPVKPGRRRG